eukprot:UN22548
MSEHDTVNEVYRGCDLTTEQVSEWKEVAKRKDVISFPCHSSTSTNKEVAIQFMGRDKTKIPVLFKVVFPDGKIRDTMVVPISTHSAT